MTIILFAMIFLSNPAKSWGQDIVKLSHIVQRGETIENLADKYRLTTDILKTVNLGMDTFYTGLEVFIPVDKKYLWLRSEEDSEKILEDIAGYFSEYQEASRIFNSGDYKKADKLFESTIQNHGKYLPCEEAYFGKAMCDYNRKKWSSAIDGFSQVISIDECPEELKEQSRSLKANAEDQREARNQRTANFFSGLFQAAAEVGTAYMAASQANAGQTGYNYPSMPQGKSLGSMSNAEFTNYVNTSLAQLANYSMMQVEQQWKQEEMQVKTGFATSYRQLHGKDPSAEEVQAAYNNYMQTKVNAYKTVQQASSGMYDRELGISGSASNKRTSSGYNCSQCRDTHVCQTCNGSGWQNGMGDNHDHYGAGINKIPCGNCSNGHSKGDGVCHFCK
ncbi:MAG: LysM domain-containing protein [Segatella copri]|nr:LysM domain-containing protein [Segatella copri]